MVRYLSEKTGIAQKKDIEFKYIDQLRMGKKKKLRYPSYDVVVVSADGTRYPYMVDGNKRFDQCGIVADKFVVSVYRKAEEFGIPLQSAGKYKDWEGDGYFSIPLYKIDDCYFAPGMDCAH